MPIYEYQCTKCGKKFEARQSLGENGSGLGCPVCKAGDPKRLISSFSSPGLSTHGLSGGSCPTCNTGTCGLPPM